MIGENKAHVQFPYYSVNTDKENRVWLVQAGLPVVPDSSGNQVLEMVCVNGCWELKSGINQ
jgi:hypothetical protein